jgi:hypothetical protein
MPLFGLRTPLPAIVRAILVVRRRVASAASRGLLALPGQGVPGEQSAFVISPAPSEPLPIAAPTTPRARVILTCLECGVNLTGQRKKFCSERCKIAHNRAIRPTHYSAARVQREARQAAFVSPSVTAQPALSKRRQSIADQAAGRAAWEAAHREVNLAAERARFNVEILPRLDETPIPVRAIADALGVSSSYASQIREGEVVPHPMYYAALDALLS